jgi:hypothetical protein
MLQILLGVDRVDRVLAHPHDLRFPQRALTVT